ncbi:hypothetical protein CEXT_207791 [Caerostris extrusa]|uniref:Uncharacterized protein n=1 Tax=Caerostris extrusa TaxID=172846 RepID=A0AAV4TJE4_CAEEX|nr:hypothetical protein CEXT_207791 [Caerostris extrusa]
MPNKVRPMHYDQPQIHYRFIELSVSMLTQLNSVIKVPEPNSLCNYVPRASTPRVKLSRPQLGPPSLTDTSHATEWPRSEYCSDSRYYYYFSRSAFDN